VAAVQGPRASKKRRMVKHNTRGVDMKRLLASFVRDESGATAIEYGLIAAGISVAIIAAVQSLGSNIGGTFNNVSGTLANAGK
jgi:pilus assembly protein Flp/PilA